MCCLIRQTDAGGAAIASHLRGESQSPPLTLKGASGAILSGMAECCCPPVEARTGRACPACGAKTSPVDLATVKALLTPIAMARLVLETFRFCGAPACTAVYVSDGGLVFDVSDVRVPVWQKLPPGHRMVCYCFGENEGDLRREFETQGRTRAVERVRGHIAERRCACDVRNPRGACCLGDLTAVIARLEAEREAKI
jgi:hypothetical protein